MNSKRVGNIGEAKALAKFVELGIPVYIPFGDNESADLVAEFNGKLNKIQCKTTSVIKNDILTWSLSSTIVTKSSKYKTHIYSRDEVDYFVLYHSVVDLLLLVPIEEVLGRQTISFTYPYKVCKSAHNQRNFKDFIFDNIIGG